MREPTPQPFTKPPGVSRGLLRVGEVVCCDGLGGGKYPYSHNPNAEHDLRNTAIPLHWGVFALAIALPWIAYRTIKGWT